MSQETEQFLSRLRQLETKFEGLAPVMELSVRDAAQGVEAFVVVWNTEIAKAGPLGPCGKGGTRISPTVSLEEVKMLARIMALKNAAAGLPLGGAKSGIRADPSTADFEKKYRTAVRLIQPVLRENGGVFGGFGFDVGGRPEHVAWVCDELQSRKSFTGKPLEWGGTHYDREGIAGLGVATAARVTLQSSGKDPKNTRFSVQGIGAMGGAVVRYFSEWGARLSAIADPVLGGCFHLPESLALDGLLAHLGRLEKHESKLWLESAGLKPQALDNILDAKTDIFFPCALQDVVTAENQNRLQVEMLVEGANNPCSSAARRALADRGILVIPDFIANPGGIIAAFVEMTVAVSDEENVRDKVKPKEAKRLTQERISENVTKVLSDVARYSITPEQAGRALALSRIVG